MRMHADELHVDAQLVRELLAVQFPDLAGLPLVEVRSTGTVNAIVRIGDELCARLPRRVEWAPDLEREWRWLPILAPRLPLRTPAPVALGRPDGTYPLPWAIYRWLDGGPYEDEAVDDEPRAARELAAFVAAVRRVAVPPGAPRAGRQPLATLDAATRTAIAAGRSHFDIKVAEDAWERALAAPAWDGRPAWIHGDLLRPNVLVHAGRIHAVIDWGSAGAGDPATDLIPAWSIFGPAGRAAFRASLAVDDGSWDRARGIALHQASLIVPYYADTNPAFAAMARRTIQQVIDDRP